MGNDSRRIVRTLRCKNSSVPGTLGKLTTAIGRVGADIGNVSTVHQGHQYTVRDIDVLVDGEDHLARVVDSVAGIREVSVLQIRDAVLELHRKGKIKTINTVTVRSLDDLGKVYTPGVAEVCKLIKDTPSLKDDYTTIPRSVAIVTDGTAVLGLGNIGPVAGMPVMEGKSALLRQMVGISGIPILLDTTDPEEIVDTVKHIAETFGGIQLEDIASPRCFLIEERLEKELSIPVMHDDQKGTAVVTLAALINACELCEVALQDAKIGLLGLGAAGLTIGGFLLRYTGNPTMGAARTTASLERHAERGGTPSNIDEIMDTCDIVVATTGVKNLIEPRMVRKGQIIFALSNPYPEIAPESARASGAALALDGRTVNNLLGYPGIWRGALDAKASEINYEMCNAAAAAIAAAANEGELVPSPIDPKVHLEVAHCVARAAMVWGVAQRHLDEDYFESTHIEDPT